MARAVKAQVTPEPAEPKSKTMYIRLANANGLTSRLFRMYYNPNTFEPKIGDEITLSGVLAKRSKPWQKGRRKLTFNYFSLSKSLPNMEAKDGWQAFLEIPDKIFAELLPSEDEIMDEDFSNTYIYPQAGYHTTQQGKQVKLMEVVAVVVPLEKPASAVLEQGSDELQERWMEINNMT